MRAGKLRRRKVLLDFLPQPAEIAFLHEQGQVFPGQVEDAFPFAPAGAANFHPAPGPLREQAGQPGGLPAGSRDDNDLPGQGPEAVKIDEEFLQRLRFGIVQGGQVKITALAYLAHAHGEKSEERLPPQEAGSDDVTVAAAAGRDVGAQRKTAQRFQVFLGPLRPLEIQSRRQRAHALAQPGRHLALAPLEQVHGVGGLPAVGVAVDFAGAGGGTALDVIKEAGDALVEDRGAAGAQAEQPGDGIDQAPGLAGIDQRAEGEAAGRDAPRVKNAGGVVGQRDLDEGKALVVFQPDIERRQVTVDQVAFQQQGVGFAFGDDGLQGTGLLQQAPQHAGRLFSGNTGRRAS